MGNGSGIGLGIGSGNGSVNGSVNGLGNGSGNGLGNGSWIGLGIVCCERLGKDSGRIWVSFWVRVHPNFYRFLASLFAYITSVPKPILTPFPKRRMFQIA